MPENFFKKINAKILPQWKACFITAILVGILAHFYKITNWLPNWDSLVFRYHSQNMISLGRWFLPIVCSFSSFYDLPFLNGLIAIAFHGLGAVCICQIFNIKKKVTAGMIGAMAVSVPTVTSVMMYNYVADGYSMAFFLSALAAVYLTKEKPRFILSAVLIALSMGIYQAYITVTITLVLIKLIDEMVYHNVLFGDIFKKGLLILLGGILGGVLYFVILKSALAIFSVEMLDYQGVNDAMSLSGLDIFASLYVIKETFIKCFFDLSQGINVYVALNTIVLPTILVFYLICIIRNKVYKKPVNIIAIIVLSFVLLLGAGALAFINAGVDYHNLMLMGYVMFYLPFLVMYERGADRPFKCWFVLILTIVIIANQVVIANVSYHKAQIAYEKSYGVLIRIADRIDSTSKTEDCDRILVVGALDNSEDYSVNLTPDITGITDGYIIRADDETVGQSVLTAALNDYCEKNYEFISGDEKKALLEKEEIKSMPKWPAEGCVKVTDDVIVIKLGTEGEN